MAEFDILYGQGISREGSLLDLAVTRDIIHKSGAWFSYNDQRIGQGRENARAYLRDNPQIAAAIEKIIRDELRAGKIAGKLEADADGSPAGGAATEE